MLRGFKNFLMRGDVIVVAIGFIVATAFSTLIKAFASDFINPLVNAIQGGHGPGLGVHVRKGAAATFINVGDFIAAVVYFVIFMAVLYFAVVVPYKKIQARRGETVFGDPEPVKTCPECLSEDVPAAARKCKYCGSAQSAAA